MLALQMCESDAGIAHKFVMIIFWSNAWSMIDQMLDRMSVDRFTVWTRVLMDIGEKARSLSINWYSPTFKLLITWTM